MAETKEKDPILVERGKKAAAARKKSELEDRVRFAELLKENPDWTPEKIDAAVREERVAKGKKKSYSPPVIKLTSTYANPDAAPSSRVITKKTLEFGGKVVALDTEGNAYYNGEVLP